MAKKNEVCLQSHTSVDEFASELTKYIDAIACPACSVELRKQAVNLAEEFDAFVEHLQGFLSMLLFASAPPRVRNAPEYSQWCAALFHTSAEARLMMHGLPGNAQDAYSLLRERQIKLKQWVSRLRAAMTVIDKHNALLGVFVEATLPEFTKPECLSRAANSNMIVASDAQSAPKGGDAIDQTLSEAN